MMEDADDILRTVRILKKNYCESRRALRDENSSVSTLRRLLKQTTKNIVRVDAIRQGITGHRLHRTLRSIRSKLILLESRLKTAIATAEDRLCYRAPQSQGSTGRPRFDISAAQLALLRDAHFSWNSIARLLGEQFALPSHFFPACTLLLLCLYTSPFFDFLIVLPCGLFFFICSAVPEMVFERSGFN